MSRQFATNVTTIMTFSVPSPSSRPLLDFAGKLFDRRALCDLPILAFLGGISLLFFACARKSLFFWVFSLLPRNFRVSEERRNPFFFVVFLAVYRKKKSKEVKIRGVANPPSMTKKHPQRITFVLWERETLFLREFHREGFFEMSWFEMYGQVGMNGDTFAIKAPEECSKKFAATFRGKFLTRGNALRIFLFQGAPKGRQQKGETGPGTHIFADFCRFSLIFGSLCKSRDLGVADLRRKPQETADFRRKTKKILIFAETGFSHLLSPFWRAPIRYCFAPPSARNPKSLFWEETLLLTVGAFLLTVELLCLQSLKAFIRRTLPL